MLKLTIRFESSWTNSFFENRGQTPLFTSQRQLTESAKKLTATTVSVDQFEKNSPRYGFLKSAQEANPDLLYRVPSSFDLTVQGTLARLVGEIRRMRDLEVSEPDHLAFRAFSAGSYELHIEHEASYLTTLTTRSNPHPSGGAGVVQESALYSDSVESRNLFGHLSFSLKELQRRLNEGLSFDSEWYPRSPSELLTRLTTLESEQRETIKSAGKNHQEGSYQSPYSDVFHYLAKILPEQAKKYIESGGALDDWPIASAIVIAKIAKLSIAENEKYRQRGLLNKNGNVVGIATGTKSGKVGGVTPKDIYAFASGQRAMSHRMPCNVPIPMILPNGKKDRIPAGVLKKTGTLLFQIDGNSVLEEELRSAIISASVGPFHFGKKGVAYVQSLKRV